MEGGITERLRTVPLFSDLTEASLSEIAKCANDFEAPAGQVLVQPNAPGSGLYFIEEGSVLVETPKRRLERGAGECFGELALLTDRARTARVRAVTLVRGFAISRFDFRNILETEPTVALHLLEVMASRLADTTA